MKAKEEGTQRPKWAKDKTVNQLYYKFSLKFMLSDICSEGVGLLRWSLLCFGLKRIGKKSKFRAAVEIRGQSYR